MANKLRVICIKQNIPPNQYGGITHIGGIGWQKTQREAINEIDSHTSTFFVSVQGKEVDVIVANENGSEYLRTSTDNFLPNNLLSLPRCP